MLLNFEPSKLTTFLSPILLAQDVRSLCKHYSEFFMASTLANLALAGGYGDVEDEIVTSTPFMKKSMCVKVIVVVTCALSMLGASLIILSFACCRDLRSKGRQILVNISIMDLGVGLFNLAGALAYFEDHFDKRPCSNCTTYLVSISTPFHCTEEAYCLDSPIWQHLCLSQACLSMICTFGSILWTNSLCFYLYFRIVHGGTKIAYYSLYISYVICYGMPILITVWLALTGRLGYSPYESLGWCSIVLMDPTTKERDIFASVFGYNLWIVLTFIFVPVLSCTVHMNVKNKTKNTAIYRRSDKFMLALLSIDYKFLAIPLAFILLRVWSLVGDILHLYVGLHRPVSLILIVLGGIGDSGQGITNALIFVIFTNKFKDTVKGLYRKLIMSYGGNAMNIQAAAGQNAATRAEEKSLLDSTTVDNISPHHFTYQSYENTTPLERSLET